MMSPLVFMEKRPVFQEKTVESGGLIEDLIEESAALGFCLMMAATHLPTTHTHTAHTAQTTTFRMRSHLLSEKNGEGNKRKRKDYFGVVNGEKKR